MINIKISIGLIHNRNEKRFAYIYPKLSELVAKLAQKHRCNYFETEYQPIVKPHQTTFVLYRKLLSIRLEWRWSKYLEFKNFQVIWKLFSGLFQILKFFDIRKLDRRKSSIEVILTDKHIRTWVKFLETDSDFLVCFEDDAEFKIDSICRVSELFSLVDSQCGSPLYIDLAGGFGLSELRVSNLICRKNNKLISFRKPLTNTTCAYLINRPLAEYFIENINNKPILRLYNADWLMNFLFINLKKLKNPCICMHSEPTIFNHGSITGLYESEIRT